MEKCATKSPECDARGEREQQGPSLLLCFPFNPHSLTLISPDLFSLCWLNWFFAVLKGVWLEFRWEWQVSGRGLANYERPTGRCSVLTPRPCRCRCRALQAGRGDWCQGASQPPPPLSCLPALWPPGQITANSLKGIKAIFWSKKRAHWHIRSFVGDLCCLGFWIWIARHGF